MIHQLARIQEQLEEGKFERRELQMRVREAERMFYDVLGQLKEMSEAAEDQYQERLEYVAPFIKTLTLAQLGTLRWMNDSQWQTFLRKYEPREA